MGMGPRGRQSEWLAMCSRTLPALAKAGDPAQAQWPVTREDSFARIILDEVVGRGEAPWTQRLDGPAWKKMSEEQTQACLALGRAIADGSADLVALNTRSLAARERADQIAAERRAARKLEQKEAAKRKRDDALEATAARKAAKLNGMLAGSEDVDLAESATNDADAPEAEAPKEEDPEVVAQKAARAEQARQEAAAVAEAQRLVKSSSLVPYRKTVLLALCQVPRGRYTTYGAISEFLASSPRAVGNALRNNPFAPAVPCHRVLASDGKIGGFKGQWGEGDEISLKRRILREEGLKFDGTGKVASRPWKGFK